MADEEYGANPESGQTRSGWTKDRSRSYFSEGDGKGKAKKPKRTFTETGTKVVATGKLKGTAEIEDEDGSTRKRKVTIDDDLEEIKRKQWNFGRPFVVLFIGDDTQPKLGAPAEELTDVLTNRELKVFFRILRKGLWNSTYAPINTAQLSAEMGMHQTNVSRAVAKMVKEGVLLRCDQKDGAHYQYRVNPYLLWRGSAKAYYENALRGDLHGIGKEKSTVKTPKVTPRKKAPPEGMTSLINAREDAMEELRMGATEMLAAALSTGALTPEMVRDLIGSDGGKASKRKAA